MIFRRHVIRILAGGLISRLFAESYTDVTPCAGAPRSEVDRLLDANPSLSHVPARLTKYSASATVMLFSIPLVSRGGVGSGYAVVQEAACPGGTGISIQFGAGSWPEAARGLNRFGLIREVTLESPAGEPEECAYYAFMTASPEKDITQAKQALTTSGDVLPCIAAQGHGSRGTFASRVQNLELPSRLTWRDADKLAARVHDAIAGAPCLPEGERGGASTFLYSLRRAMLDSGAETPRALFFNSKRFLLDTRKERDAAAGARLAERRVTTKPDSVMRLSAVLTNRATGHQTPFHVWYEEGSEGAPPLRFEYQAKSFLRLAFEADPAPPALKEQLVAKERQG